MSGTLAQAGALMVVILLGWLVRRMGGLKGTDFHVLCSVALNVTIPCAILWGTRTMTLGWSSLALMGIGFGLNWVSILIAFYITRGKAPIERAFTLFNLPGFNIGCFALPYAQGILGSEGIVTACMFDAGNSVMCCGINYAVGASVLGVGAGSRVKNFFKRVFSSTPFIVYLCMLFMRGFDLTLPDFCWRVIGLVAPANVFLAMFMLGVGLKFKINAEDRAALFFHLRWRALLSLIFGAFVWFALPFDGENRLALLLMALSPATIIATAFTARVGGNAELATTYNSATTLLSFGLMTAAVMFLS